VLTNILDIREREKERKAVWFNRLGKGKYTERWSVQSNMWMLQRSSTITIFLQPSFSNII
jgi:hypothetical protein